MVVDEVALASLREVVILCEELTQPNNIQKANQPEQKDSMISSSGSHKE